MSRDSASLAATAPPGKRLLPPGREGKLRISSELRFESQSVCIGG